MLRSLVFLAVSLWASVSVAQPWDISALTDIADDSSYTFGVQNINTHRFDADDIDSLMGASWLLEVANVAESRTPDSRSRYWLAPTDFGAVGYTANSDLDEGDLVAATTLIGKLAAERKNGAGATPYSVNLTLDGGYRCGQFIEIQNGQRIYGAFEFTGATSHNGKTTLHWTTDWIEEWKEGGGISANEQFPHLVQRSGADNVIVENVWINGHADDLFVNESINHIWFAEADFTVDAATDVFTSVGHDLQNGYEIHVETDDTLPTGLAVDTTYTVINATTDTFKLEDAGGVDVDVSDTGSGTHNYDNVGGYNLSTISDNLRNSPIGGGIWNSNQSNRVQAKDLTFDNIYVQDIFGTNFWGGARNHATGRVCVGNSISGRPLYRGEFPDVLERLDLFGYTRSSHCRLQGPSTVNNLIFSIAGPFGNGTAGSPWSNNPATAGSQNVIAFERKRNGDVDGSKQKITINNCSIDLRDYVGSSHVPRAFQMQVDLEITGTISGVPGNIQDSFATHPDAPVLTTGSSMRAPVTLDIDLTTTDCRIARFGWMVDGSIIVDNTLTEVDDPEDLDLTPNDTAEHNAINSAAMTQFLLRKGNRSNWPEGYEARLTVHYTTDWYMQTLLHIPDIFTDSAFIDVTTDHTTETFTDTGHGKSDGDRIGFMSSDTLPTGMNGWTVYHIVNADTDTFQISTTAGGSAVNITDDGTGNHKYIEMIPPENFVPIYVNYRPVTRNYFAKWIALNTGVSESDDPHDLFRFYPLHIRLEHPGTITWDDVSPGSFVGDNEQTIHSDIYHLWDYTGVHNKYYRVFLVPDAEKAEANQNMVNAGNGSNAFSVSVTKTSDMSTWWACPIVVNDADLDEYQQASDSAVELTVTGTDPEAFREAIVAGGYTVD